MLASGGSADGMSQSAGTLADLPRVQLKRDSKRTSHVAAYGPLITENLIDRSSWHAKRIGEVALRPAFSFHSVSNVSPRGCAFIRVC